MRPVHSQLLVVKMKHAFLLCIIDVLSSRTCAEQHRANHDTQRERLNDQVLERAPAFCTGELGFTERWRYDVEGRTQVALSNDSVVSAHVVYERP